METKLTNEEKRIKIPDPWKGEREKLEARVGELDHALNDIEQMVEEEGYSELGAAILHRIYNARDAGIPHNLKVPVQ